nr:hypothetical protein [Tanacetum cinerariifolium]
GPYKPTTVLVHAVEATDNSPAVPEHTTIETPSNMSPENKAHFLAEKQEIHLILNGIGDDIYSSVDAFQTAQEMWEAIERLQQASTWMPRGHTWLTRGMPRGGPSPDPIQTRPRPDPDPAQVQALTAYQQPLTGGPVVVNDGLAAVNGGSPPPTVIDRHR